MLLERDKELGLLADLLAGVGSSGGRVVLVRGEAGIGKSVLVRDFGDGHADAAHVYFGFCDDLVMEGKPVEAAAIWEAKGIPYEQALAFMHGDETAQVEALEILETLGATAVAAKLRQSLRDQGVSVPRGKKRETRRHDAGLTARQAEVLQLLDEDLSNVEIADRLFLSARTVEHHVAAVMSKLNASTRHEAVVLAAEQGLLATG
jgi:DNA-binding CsgD family transcriptional regulator